MLCFEKGRILDLLLFYYTEIGLGVGFELGFGFGFGFGLKLGFGFRVPFLFPSHVLFDPPPLQFEVHAHTLPLYK